MTPGPDAGSARPPAVANDDAAADSPRASGLAPIPHWQILAIAGPIMLSNATTPLVGYADTVVVGRLGSEVLMGAVALAANVFNYVYWIFGFLRMGTTGFTAQASGARAGDLTLAANALLFSIAMICVYLLDGFAFAAETLVGDAIGAKRKSRFRAAVAGTTIWAAIVAVVLSALLWFGGGLMIDFATTNADVRDGARVYLVWAAMLPLVGVWCFQLDGIFIGATQSAEMRNMMLVSLVGYLAVAAVLIPAFGNHGLWLSLYAFFVIRAATLAMRLPALAARSFPDG